jgi:tetratricopeptide (TPR) repeat protein
MFCLYCGKKIDGAVFLCEICGNANKLEPFAHHIMVRPKALPVSGAAAELIVIETTSKNFSKVILTNKRVIMSNFFSGSQLYLNNIKYAEYSQPDRSDFYKSGLVGYLSKKFFSDGITFFGDGGVKLFELKLLEDADALMRAFNAAKSGVTPLLEIAAMKEYSGGGFINAFLSAIENISGAPKGTGLKSLYDETAYLADFRVLRQPKADSGNFAKGIASFEAGDFEKAELAFKKHCADNPRDETGFVCHAAALDNLGRFDEAIIVYDRSLAINRASVYTLKMQAYSLYRAARYHEACDNFEKASEFYSSARDNMLGFVAGNAVFLGECAFGAACCYHKTGSLNDALGRFESALGYNGDNAAAWIKKGFCHQELGEYNRAVSCYDAAAKIMRCPASAMFYSAVARCEPGTGHHKNVGELFLDCARSAPIDSELKAEAEAAIAGMSDGTLASWIKQFFRRQ